MEENLEKIEKFEFSTDECKAFSILVDKFCESLTVEKNSSEHTVRNYKNDLMSFAIWCERMQLDPCMANYRELRGYLAEMDGAKYARTTINRRLSSLRSFFKWLDVIGEETNNFADVMKGPKILKTLPHVVRHNDIENLMKVCMEEIEASESDIDKSKAKRDYSIMELFYATGARISEVANLKLENINFESGQIKFFGKGMKERIVPIYNIAASALADYIENARGNLLRGNSSDICFIGNSGRPMSADSIRKMFYKKCEAAGVSSEISPHAMRHTFATDVLDGGADLRSVQEMLGHASLSTTQIYTHLSAKKLKDVHAQAHPRG
ncbi:MAG: tyrosine recombinase [Coriobacteriia bacterium]|nr:tyrosine recombinase [Coriobacteriia bacterium]